MDEKTKNILSLNHKEAMDFFLKSEQYHGFELPEYFVFDELLQNVKEAVRDKPYEECLQDGLSPENLSDVNLEILLNKDGRYAVRPIILANPFLYYFLVREICNEKSWTLIKKLFERFLVPHITSCALPIIPKDKESFHKSTTILNWWSSMEQRSIELSLEYRYMFVTDITNCYGSVNPQAFDWAFSFKDTEHEQKTENPIAKNIQKHHLNGTTILILASEHKNVEQMLFETIKITTLLINYRCIVDICKFIGFDSISNNTLANLSLLAIHAEVQTLQYVLKNV